MEPGSGQEGTPSGVTDLSKTGFAPRSHAGAISTFSNETEEARVSPSGVLSEPSGFTSEHGERLRAERRESVRRLYQRGLVPMAIADVLGWSDSRVARYLRELVDDGVITRPPSWLTLYGPKRSPRCSACGK